MKKLTPLILIASTVLVSVLLAGCWQTVTRPYRNVTSLQPFPAGAITRIQVVEYGDDPEVEPEKTALRVFFDWAGRTEGNKADPKTVPARNVQR